MKGKRKVNRKRLKKYPLQAELIFGLGLIPKEGVPEIKVRYNRSPKRIFLGKVTNSKDAADFIRKTFPFGSIQLQERFVVLYLSRAHEILGYYRLAIGGIAGIVVDPRIIFATALASLATGIILSHNHPSGNLTASQADIALTKKLKEGGKTLEIEILDHIILSKTGYYSFADHGLL